MSRSTKIMDGNTAAAHVSYAFTDVAGIFPITPSSVMAELVDEWSAHGRKNLFGQPVRVAEMQSEGGAAGAIHGAVAVGALSTTYTASQGLLLMIPNMYKMAGEMQPNVIHCSARQIATHALSIFGEHSDVMACRATGYALLASTNPQEVMDLGAVAHLAAIKSRIPFLHFFDGFRTSHEVQKIKAWDYEALGEMLDWEAVDAYRRQSHNPAHPVLRGGTENPDIYFQLAESRNLDYAALPDIVQNCMNQVNAKAGTDYRLFNYYGAPDAEHVLVAMGSVNDAIDEVIDHLTARGEKVGAVKVRLYRPFVMAKFVEALPDTVRGISVLDRTKEPGAIGEPLYLDVVTALAGTKFAGSKVAGGRYGLGSKDVTPGCVIAALRNIQSDSPRHSFTVGITDDVSMTSLPITEEPDVTSEGTISCKFWGFGSDGTVGANKNSIKIIGEQTDLQTQAYFQYDSKKSGGVTISHLRFGKKPIKSTYYVTKADFIACHKPAYLEKYDMVQDIKPGGTFLINCAWDVEELGRHLPAKAKKYLAENHINVYTIDAVRLAREIGLGGRTNTILQASFFKLASIIPIEQAVKYMAEAIENTYGRKGAEIVRMNISAIDAGLEDLKALAVPEIWKNAVDGGTSEAALAGDRPELLEYIKNVLRPVNAMKGDDLPVSALMKQKDGTFPQGAAAYEKRGVAVDVPVWAPENCIQCNQCSLVCPHAVIRPFVMTGDELAKAPEGTKSVRMTGRGCEHLQFSIIPSVYDCTGCGSCANVCPSKNKALEMKPFETQLAVQNQYDYAYGEVTEKADELPFAKDTVKGSQFRTPLLEFNGACAGCGEPVYPKLVTQLFGDRTYIANATGCSTIWTASAPSTPYTVNKQGRGPTWHMSLFEDNAEFGYGMCIGAAQLRKKAIGLAESLIESGAPAYLADAAKAWLDSRDDGDGSKPTSAELAAALEQAIAKGEGLPLTRELYALKDSLIKPSIWLIGGDGWAYDIGYGGLDHVLASGENLNILVLDTEVYSNTGGQASKASQAGQVAQFAAAGKPTRKKELALMATTYGYVYVAQVAMGANYQQTVRAIAEAESYDGPSLIVAYAPCINHGIKKGMGYAMAEAKSAVDSGYWNLFRYDPRLEAEGKNPFQLDSKEPGMSYLDFIRNEVRYSSLEISFPERAQQLFAEAEKNAASRYRKLADLAKGHGGRSGV